MELEVFEGLESAAGPKSDLESTYEPKKESYLDRRKKVWKSLLLDLVEEDARMPSLVEPRRAVRYRSCFQPTQFGQIDNV